MTLLKLSILSLKQAKRLTFPAGDRKNNDQEDQWQDKRKEARVKTRFRCFYKFVLNQKISRAK